MLYHHRILHTPAQVTAQVPAPATVHTTAQLSANAAILQSETQIHSTSSTAKVVHVSQLKKVADAAVYRVMLVDDSLPEFAPLASPQTQPLQLTTQQQQKLDNTLSEFPQVFSDMPGRTTTVKHCRF